MADLNARIKPKKSSTTGEVPQAADLEVAEIAVNTADGKLFVKHTDDSIKEISGSGGGGATALSDLSDVLTESAATATWAGTWTVSTLTPGQAMNADGNMGPSTSDTTNFYINDNSGTSYAAELSALNGSTLYWRKNSEPWQSETMTGYLAYQTNTLIPYAAALSASVNAAQLGDNYSLSDGTPAVSPSDGQVLTWVEAGSQWEAVDTAPNLVTSVNGETGAVSLSVSDLDDVASVTSLMYATTPEGPGGFNFNGGYFQLGNTDSDGNTLSVSDLPGGTIWISTNADPVQAVPYFNAVQVGDDFVQFQYDAATHVFTKTAPCLVYLSDPSGVIPADGQVLTWVDANNQWEAADAAGGGGAVDSVNGEIGVVSLGIQDMDDFTLSLSAPIYAGNTSKYNDIAAPSPGDWGIADVLPTWLIYNNAQGASMGLLETGDAVTLTAGELALNANLAQGPTYNGAQSKYIVLDVPFTQDWFDLPSGTALVVTSTRFPAGFEPLIEGDVLQWNTADQKFKPAQLPAGGGAVTSVNGETGAVSLSVSDLNNVGLLPDPAADVYTLSGPGSNDPNASGQWGVGSALNNYFTWFDTDPVHAYLSSLPIGSIVEFVTEGGYVHSAVTTSLATANGSNSDYISFAGHPWPQEILDAQANNESIIVRDPSAADAFLPPADGQVLTWVDANSQWEPADAVGGSGGGAVDSVNGETGVVSLGIRDMDDFGYVMAPSANSFTLTTGVSVTPASSGEWRVSGSNFVWYNTDSINAWLASLAIGSTVEFITVGGYKHVSTNTSGYLVNTSSTNYMPFSDPFPQEILDAATAGEALVVQEPRTDMPLAVEDGQVLTWVDANNQWEPADAAGGGGAVDSVNGETGVVSLSVLSLSDFDSQGFPATVGGAANGSYIDGFADKGRWHWDSSTAQEISQYDADGNWRVVDYFNNWSAGDTVEWFEVGVGSLGSGVMSLVNVDNSYRRVYWFLESGSISAPSSSTASVYVVNHSVEFPATQPAEGDILRWNNSEQRFMSSSDYISLTTLKAEVAASADFADFQARIAAL